MKKKELITKIKDHRFYKGSFIKKLITQERQEMLKIAKSIGHLTELNTIFYIMEIPDILLEKKRKK